MCGKYFYITMHSSVLCLSVSDRFVDKCPDYLCADARRSSSAVSEWQRETERFRRTEDKGYTDYAYSARGDIIMLGNRLSFVSHSY